MDKDWRIEERRGSEGRKRGKGLIYRSEGMDERKEGSEIRRKLN